MLTGRRAEQREGWVMPKSPLGEAAELLKIRNVPVGHIKCVGEKCA